LFVSNNGRELVEAERIRHNLDEREIIFVSARREEVPAFICLAKLSVIFIRSDISKAGCSPTKLAELFACNVPVIVNTGVGDMDAIIALEQNGSVLIPDFEDSTLRCAIGDLLAASDQKIPIRENSYCEMSLETGINKYALVYDELLGTSLAAMPAAQRAAGGSVC
jgi:hypothetical protein